MSANVFVGLASSAHTTSRLNVGTFDNVSVTGDTTPTPPAYNTLPAPANPAVTPVPGTGTALVLDWDEVVGATGYRVERSLDGIAWSQIALPAAGVLTYTDTGANTFNRYFYRVAGRDASGNSAPSEVVSATNRPAAVTNLSTIAYSQTALIVKWKDVAGDTGYRVERSADGGINWTTVVTTAPNVPAYVNTGLTSGTTYNYRITPLSADGDGASSTLTGATRLPAVTGIGFNSVASTALALRWTDLTAETGYRVDRSTDGTTFTTLTNLPANTTTFTDTSATPLKEYYYRILGTKGTSLSLMPTTVFAATPAATPLPNPWTATDIGTATGRGASGFASGTFTSISSGNDLTGSADAFRFTYQPLVGDGEIVARVASVEDTDTLAKAGVTIRASLATNAPHVSIFATRGSGIDRLSRATAGAATTTVDGPTNNAPYWVKLTRAGNTFTAYASPDGNTWTPVGSPVTVNMSGTAYIGLASASRVTTELNTSTFTNVTVTNTAPTFATAPTANPNPVTTADTTALSALGADDHGEANLTYTWSVMAYPDGAVPPTFSASGTNAAKNATATFFAPGAYQFLVRITDAGGLSTTATVDVAVTTPFPQVTGASFHSLRKLSFTFDADVSASLAPADLVLTAEPAPGTPYAATDVAWDADTKTATFTFAVPLPHGDYRATLARDGVADPAGLRPTADYAYTFHALTGDLTGDRTVDFNDLVVLAQNYAQPDPAHTHGDLNGDGTVNFDDLVLLTQNYNASLPTPPPPAASIRSPFNLDQPIRRTATPKTAAYARI
jgi:fibronectin type 3 domain-containing protein